MRTTQSKNFKVERSIEACYTGGKICIAQRDQTKLFSWCNGDVAIFQVSDGSIISKIESGEDDSFISFAVDPKGSVLVTSAKSQLLTSWDLKNEGKKIKAWKGHQLPVLAMEIDPTGTLVATGSTDRTVRVWDISSGQCTHRFTGHGGTVSTLCFRPQYSSRKMELIGCSGGGEIRVMELYSRQVKVLTDHIQTATGVSFSIDGTRMFSVGRDRVINTWSTSNYSLIRTMPVYEELEGVVTLPPSVLFRGSDVNNQYIATAGEKGRIVVWDTERTTQVFKVELVPDTEYSAGEGKAEDEAKTEVPEVDERKRAQKHVVQMFLAESFEGGGAVVTATQEHNIRFHSLLGLSQSRVLVGHNDEVLDIAWAPAPLTATSLEDGGEEEEEDAAGGGDGDEGDSVRESEAVFVAANSPDIRLYDIRTLDCCLLYGHTDTVISLSISKDRKFLLSGSKDQTVRIWRLRDEGVIVHEDIDAGTRRSIERPRCVGVVTGHTMAIGAVAACQQAQHHFFLSTSRDTTLKLWDYTGLMAEGYKGRKKKKKKIDNKKSGKRSKDKPERLSKSEVGVIAHEKDINGLAISLDDKMAATGSSDRTVKLWALPSLRAIATLKGHKRGVWSVAFSPVDRVVCSSSGDQTVKIWSVDGDFACLRTFQGHEASVTQAIFLNAGTQLLSASSDAAIKLWTIKTNECVSTFTDAHDDKIWALKAVGDGAQVVSGGEDSKIVFWRDSTEEEEAEEQAKRDATVLREQELRNSLRNKDWAKAIRIALDLTHSRQLYKIFQHLYRHAPNDVVLREALGECSPDDRAKIVQWTREWNTHTQYVPVAHFILSRLLRAHPLFESKEHRQDIRTAAKHIIVYSERHLKRLDKLLQRTYLFDHMLASTSLLPVSASDSKGTLLPDEVASDEEAEEVEDDDSMDDLFDEDDAILVKATRDPLDELDESTAASDGFGAEGAMGMESNWDEEEEAENDHVRDDENDDVETKEGKEDDDDVEVIITNKKRGKKKNTKHVGEPQTEEKSKKRKGGKSKNHDSRKKMKGSGKKSKTQNAKKQKRKRAS